MGDAAKAQDRRKLGQGVDPCGQELAAGLDLRAHGFVLGRHASDGVGDHRGFKLEAVIGSRIVFAV